MTKTNVKVKAKGNESGISLLRRFSRRVKNSGVIRKVRKTRYRKRDISKHKKKKRTLHKIRKRKEIDRAIKLGKISPRRRY